MHIATPHRLAAVLLLTAVALAAAAGDPPAESAADGAAKAGTTAPAADAAPAGEAKAKASAPAADTPATKGREGELAALLPRLTEEDELLWLDAAGHKFFAFRRAPLSGKPRGAILIIPAPGEFIDERALTHTLRTLPPAGGYVTLAVQAPLDEAAGPAQDAAIAAAPPAEAAEKDPDKAAEKKDEPVKEEAKPDAAPVEATAQAAPAPDSVHAEFCPRVEAALTALAGEGAASIAIAAEAGSATAVLDCYKGELPPSVQAFAAIGGWAGSVKTLKVPVLEFVPGRDRRAVAAADKRDAAPHAEDSPPRRRVDLDGVDRDFTGADVEVAKRLRGWLERLPKPKVAAEGP